jgi:fructose-bisphosphate aldolase class I
LSDGDHDIARCQAVMEQVWSYQIKALSDCNVMLEGCLLKPNMVTHGQNHPDRSGFSSKTIAARTLCALLRTIPPAIPGIMVNIF